MITSFIVVTDNSQEYIEDVLWSLLPLEENEELIIFDNHSTDETVPRIVSMMGGLWLDKKQRYKLESTEKKAISISKGKPIVINKKERFKIEEVIANVENK